ncbi:hypothetical protein PR048_009614, partial [Dryococelus australis]
MPTLDHVVRQFWQIEEILLPFPLNLMILSVKKPLDDTGRCSVTLSCKDPSPTFGVSCVPAFHCLHSLEYRLLRDPPLQAAYAAFMDDYIEQGQMSLVPESQLIATSYYSPHHTVHKHDNTTTKLRVDCDKIYIIRVLADGRLGRCWTGERGIAVAKSSQAGNFLPQFQ